MKNRYKIKKEFKRIKNRKIEKQLKLKRLDYPP